MSQLGSRIGKPATVAGRVLASLFFLVFLGMGILFCALLLRSTMRSQFWNPVACAIVESRVVEDVGRDAPYRFRVRYAYQWQDRSFTGDRWSHQRGTFSDYGKAQHLVQRYPLDTKTVCYVDPENPAAAVLERPNPWQVLFMLFPLVFVVIGGAGLWAIWRRAAAVERLKPLQGACPEPVEGPISTRGTTTATSQAGFALRLLVFSVFFVAGGMATYFLLLSPVARTHAAKAWLTMPCTVISSRVQSHHGDSTTYSVDILYSYELNGREFRSNRYKFMGGSSSGWKAKSEIVQRYPAGSKAVCYVDPADPNNAVLERGFTADMWLGLIPLVFGLVGAGGIAGTLRSRRGAAARDLLMEPAAASEHGPMPIRQLVGPVFAQDASGSDSDDTDPAAARVLKPSSSRIGAFLFFLVFTGVWNGVLYFGFLRQGLFGRGGGAFGWLMGLFLLPFLVIGFVLLAVTVHQFLALHNPKAELTIQPGMPALGGAVELSWRLIGRTRALRRLKLYLEGREEATHRQGTRTQTDRQPFLTIDVAAPASAEEMQCGRAQVKLPSGTVPSFKSANNRIVWAVHVRGDIPRWPDLKEEFEIQVRPGARTAE